MLAQHYTYKTRSSSSVLLCMDPQNWAAVTIYNGVGEWGICMVFSKKEGDLKLSYDSLEDRDYDLHNIETRLSTEFK